MINPGRLPVSDSGHFVKFDFWPVATVGESLQWLNESVDRFLKIMHWEPLCENKIIAYRFNYDEPNPRCETTDREHLIIIDKSTFVWPEVDADLIDQIQESVRTLTTVAQEISDNKTRTVQLLTMQDIANKVQRKKRWVRDHKKELGKPDYQHSGRQPDKWREDNRKVQSFINSYAPLSVHLPASEEPSRP